MNGTVPKVLLFSPSSAGGLAEYIFCQGEALEKSGAKVTCLVTPLFLDGRPTRFERIVCLSNSSAKNSSRLLKRLKMAWSLIKNNCVLAWQIWQRRPDLVLLDSYVEYLAPIWVWPHWILARVWHIRYAANLHDPVRSYCVGPVWWHKFSVRLAYLPLDFVLVHDRLPEPSPVPPRVRVAEVPHGIYEIKAPGSESEVVRREWGVQKEQKVFLAFGFVRDGKNLDLAVQALASVPEAFLVVAGSVASPKDKPFAFYHKLAETLGVADRCRFLEGFVSDHELGRYFSGTDFVLLTYASSFHSQSGVLQLAVSARKPVLASASPSPLLRSVRSFDLGLAVAPDSVEAIIDGMQSLLRVPPNPRWQDYENATSWETNALSVLQAAGLRSKNHHS